MKSYYLLIIAIVFSSALESLAQDDDTTIRWRCPHIKPIKREQCSESDEMNQIICERTRSCCFDDTDPDAINCFKNLECEVNADERTSCGWPGIEQGQCEDIPCCFNQDNNGQTDCYQPVE
uniref:putative gastrointestinal growth factor xP4 n=1 Tax=Ciona intestinalis TaxID=7719 RepID=UPI00089DC340|nr:putative gastrointestinal growth factor xP4 [Ciona intestinalis]|eukprot:XP_018668545.1 putative gastrointestinal growth factor xP4 [Ciona intestinalis]